MFYFIKVVLSALIIATATELSKRSLFVGALLISLPLTSILALCWRYYDTHDVSAVAKMSVGIFWLVLPSLPFFLILSGLLTRQWGFVPSLLTASAATVGIYFVSVKFMAVFGVTL